MRAVTVNRSTNWLRKALPFLSGTALATFCGMILRWRQVTLRKLLPLEIKSKGCHANVRTVNMHVSCMVIGICTIVHGH